MIFDSIELCMDVESKTAMATHLIDDLAILWKKSGSLTVSSKYPMICEEFYISQLVGRNSEPSTVT